jgi:hypothetical protein
LGIVCTQKNGDFDDFGGPFPGLRTDGTLHPRLTEGSDWFRQGPKTFQWIGLRETNTGKTHDLHGNIYENRWFPVIRCSLEPIH